MMRIGDGASKDILFFKVNQTAQTVTAITIWAFSFASTYKSNFPTL
jgi:hypothetical protein